MKSLAPALAVLLATAVPAAADRCRMHLTFENRTGAPIRVLEIQSGLVNGGQCGMAGKRKRIDPVDVADGANATTPRRVRLTPPPLRPRHESGLYPADGATRCLYVLYGPPGAQPGALGLESEVFPSRTCQHRGTMTFRLDG